MIFYVALVFSFAFVNSKTFHANQHLPVQKYQPPLQYSSPLPAYPPQYLPIFAPHLNRQGEPNAPQLTSNEIDELQRQYQQWQIALPPSSSQQPGTGTVWISAPQYSYYQPPPNFQQYPNPSPVPYPPAPPAAPLSPQSNQPAQPAANPTVTQARETIGTTPSNGSSIITNQSPSEPSNPPLTQPANQSTTTVESSSAFTTTTEFPTTILPSGSTSEGFTTTTSESITASSFNSTSSFSSTTESAGSSNPSNETTSSGTTEPPSNATSSTTTTEPSNATTTIKPSNVTTTTKPSNTTSNATDNNPLLKYCTQPRGQFQSENCSTYVNCWDEVAIEQECPNGLRFNAEKQYCDYPHNVDCGNRTTSSGNNSTNATDLSGSNNTTSNSTTNSKCPEGYGTYRNESNCAAFYVCVAGEPVEFSCPPGTNYNDQIKVCDYPYRVNCKGAPSIPIAEESSTSNVTETPQPTESSNSSSATTSPSSTSNSPTSSTAIGSSSSLSTSSPTIVPSTSTSTESWTASSSQNPSSSEATTTESSSSTLPPAPVTTTSNEFVPPGLPPADPIGYYNFNLKKLPESIVNSGVRCYHTNVFRLTPDCSSVTLCQDGLTYIINCASGTSFDAYTQRCVPTFRARC